VTPPWRRKATRGAAEAFLLWTLTIKPDHTATLACEGGNGKPVFAKAIACTDFPLLEIRLYDTDRTILLPSEYGGRLRCSPLSRQF
jgi:hypothetical protein